MIKSLLYIPWFIARFSILIGAGLCLTLFGIPAGVLCILCGLAISLVALVMVLVPILFLVLFL